MTGRLGRLDRTPFENPRAPRKQRYHYVRSSPLVQPGELAQPRSQLRQEIAQAKAEIGGRHKQQRAALQALIAAEFASRMADAMRADPAERDALIARLQEEQAARLEAAMTAMAQAAMNEKKEVIGVKPGARRPQRGQRQKLAGVRLTFRHTL